MADAFLNFENGTQKIVGNDPNHERSLKLKNAIPNVIAAYKQFNHEKVPQA